MFQQVSVADHFLSRLREVGVDEVFGVPGDFSLAFMDVLEASPDISWIGCASELGAAYAADGYARARGLGVLCTTFGVGELSAACATAGAVAEDVAVLHVVVTPPTAAWRSKACVHHTFADGDLDRFGRVAAALGTLVFDIGFDEPCDAIDRAVRHWAGRRESVYVRVPQDVLSAAVPEASAVLGAPTPQNDDPDVDDLLSAYLAAHPRATAVVGHLALRHNLRGAIDQLAQRNVPLAALPNGKGIVDETVPSYLGVYNGKLSRAGVNARVEAPTGRVLVGCVLADTTTGGFSHDFPEDSTLVVGRSSVTWAGRVLEAEIGVVVRRLAALWPGLPAPPPSKAPTELPTAVLVGDGPLTINSMWSSTAAIMPTHTRLFAETGTSYFGALDIAFPADTVFECAAVWAAIGHALPAAIGASIGDRTRQVLAVVGDGAAQVTANELGLLHRYRSNAIFVVVDNGGYTIERVIRGARASYNDVSSWDWPMVARTIGGGSTVTTSAVSTVIEYAIALEAAFSDPDRAHVIVVRTSPMDAPPTLAAVASAIRARAEAVCR
ncbi:hypothetical protein KZI27_06640 [Curtobacterium sp. TC1]|uniref:thiamine pyrophosphate-binding protein n=1 Tax=Curtobacterium sp. TC1 TaxID=2862880 RepID=UPI001C9AB371|nr:thiamine pyrophosphate-binding protein [Curtobacterium sp. TC1]QZQ56492.1 hypothetical protein KZI27_06640 [Curtobacterium sp. TC1]